MYKVNSLLFCGIFLLCSIVALPAEAQFGGSFIDSQAQIELKPNFPQPGETVTATYTNFSGTAQGATLTWLKNGELIEGSTNQRSVEFIVGRSNEAEKIELILGLPNGTKQSLSTVINPVFLDIIIEPQTRVPDFYAGRSLPSEGSMINATALVSTEGNIEDTDLVYTWSIGRVVLEGGPIRGRNQVSFETPMGSDFVLSVTVERPNGTAIARRSVRIPSVYPELQFYEVDALYGLKTKSLINGFKMVGNTATVRAEPYYLDTRVYNDPDHLEFKVNNTLSNSAASHPYEAVLQKQRGGSSVNLEFHVRSLQLLIQGVKGDVTIST